MKRRGFLSRLLGVAIAPAITRLTPEPAPVQQPFKIYEDEHGYVTHITATSACFYLKKVS